ncbi:MAG: cytochrome c [Chloroflexi bacterium]|nr:cytochrome c [Chloroflexota bacterium]
MLRIAALVLLAASVGYMTPALAQEFLEDETTVFLEDETTAEAVEGSDGVSASLIAAGEKLFQQTAGAVGCQYCHGKDAKGLVGPNVRGKSPAQLKQALGTIPVMSFITTATPLTEADIQAIAAYLKYLESQP